MPRIIAPCLALLLAVLTAVAVAQEPQVGELSSLDRQFMQQQRDLLQELAALRLGRRFSGERERDLAHAALAEVGEGLRSYAEQTLNKLDAALAD